jgi:ribonucleoside-diphosphate reductase alpha chain
MKYDVFSNKFAQDIYLQKYSLDQQETWADTARRVVNAVCKQYLDQKSKEDLINLIIERKFIPGGRYLYSAGRPYHQVNNCFLFKAEDSREGWAALTHKATAALMTGGGIGIDYSLLREEGAKIKGTGGTSTGPIALMQIINETGRYIMQGGQRRSAIWAGLNWAHKDIQKFVGMKNYSEELKAAKEKDFTFPVPMELTNISVIYDTEFFIAVENESHPNHDKAKQLFLDNCKQAFSTAEPGMSFNFRKDAESLRNACTEVVSEDDSDKCNLVTLCINRFTDKK